MKATGIVRRIDDLGRIVIPKEIRKTLKINEGSPLEIYTNSQGDIIFKKYSPIGELANVADIYAQALAKVLFCNVAICDMDKVVATAGVGKKELIDKNITDRLRSLILERKMQLCHDSIKIVDASERRSEIICLINSSGDPLGGIILSEISPDKRVNIEIYLKTIANLIAIQTE